MIKKKKILITEELPEFEASIEAMPEDSRIFVDKSMEIANYIFHVMESKNMKQKDLVGIIGGKSRVSEILNRKKSLTVDMIRELESVLQLSASILVQNYQLSNK